MTQDSRKLAADALRDLMEQIESLSGFELTKDVEQYKAQAIWEGVWRRAKEALAALDAAPERDVAERVRDTFGCALAVRVLQSNLYHKLDDEERSECDELIARWSDHLRAGGLVNKIDGGPKGDTAVLAPSAPPMVMVSKDDLNDAIECVDSAVYLSAREGYPKAADLKRALHARLLAAIAAPQPADAPTKGAEHE